MTSRQQQRIPTLLRPQGVIPPSDPSRCGAMQLAGFFHFIVERDRIEVEAVRPSEDAVIDKHACEVGGVAQGLDHRSALGDQVGEISLAPPTTGKATLQTVAAPPLSYH